MARPAASHHQDRAAGAARLLGKPRPPDRLRSAAVSVGRRHRLRGPQRLRRLDQRRRLRPRLGAALRAERLGALSHRALGLRAAVGLDLDRRAALGLRAVPLWPLGQSRQSLGLGAAAARCPAGLRAGAGGFRRRHRTGRDARQPERRAGRLVPARSARGLRAVLHDRSRLLPAPQPLGPHRGPHPRGSLAARAAARGVLRPTASRR